MIDPLTQTLLNPRQRRAIVEIESAIDRRFNRITCMGPTGFGKTGIAD